MSAGTRTLPALRCASFLGPGFKLFIFASRMQPPPVRNPEIRWLVEKDRGENRNLKVEVAELQTSTSSDSQGALSTCAEITAQLYPAASPAQVLGVLDSNGSHQERRRSAGLQNETGPADCGGPREARLGWLERTAFSIACPGWCSSFPVSALNRAQLPDGFPQTLCPTDRSYIR